MATKKSSRKASKQAEPSRTGPRGEAKRAAVSSSVDVARGDGRRRSADRGEDVRRARAARGNGNGRAEGARRTRPSGKNGHGRERCEREMEQMFGFVPSYYRAFPEAALQHAWGMQRDLEMAQSALDPKTKELIGLAMASHIKCRYCIYFHTEAALHHGATLEQLHEAIAMGGLTVLFSNAITGAQTDIDQFRREVDRALEHIAENEPSRAPSRSQITA